MYKIIAYSVKKEDNTIAQEWARENNVELTVLEEPLTMENIDQVKDYDGVSVAQMVPITRDIYERLAEFGVKQMAQRSVGVDTHDLDAASDNDVIITNVPVYSPESIAEFVVAGAMMAVRHLPLIMMDAKEYDFRWTPDKQGRLLKDMTVGILGVGHIGCEVARIFKGIGCKVIGYDLYPNDEGRKYLEYKDNVEEVVKEADIISLHMPLTKETHHLFNKEMFKKMKKHAVLLNAGRGGLVNTPDLLDALDEELIDYAFLDVYEYEEDYVNYDYRHKEIKDKIFKRLIDHPKVGFTPHLAFYTDVANRNILTFGLDEVLNVLKTGDSDKRVN